MANYNKKFNFDEKYQNIENLINFYFNTNSSNYKASRLPNWLNFYGQTLLTEKNEKINFYTKFSQGTVVTVDYGVPVGGEMSGIHFAIILSKNDTQYKNTVSVLTIPLSSHNNKDRVSLGKDILQKAQLSMDIQLSNLEMKVHLLNKEIATLSNDIKKSENELIQLNVVKHLSKKNINKINANIERYNNELTKFIKDKNHLLIEVNKFKKELARLNKYNKNSYACLNSISSVSKLKIKKFSQYGINSNISISDENLKLLKNKIKKFIDID